MAPHRGARDLPLPARRRAPRPAVPRPRSRARLDAHHQGAQQAHRRDQGHQGQAASDGDESRTPLCPCWRSSKRSKEDGCASAGHAQRARHGARASALAKEGGYRPPRAALPHRHDHAPDKISTTCGRPGSRGWRFRGDDPLKIQHRAGHTDFETTQRYIRMAEASREGFGIVFPELPGVLVSHAANAHSVVTQRNHSDKLRGGRDSNPRPPA